MITLFLGGNPETMSTALVAVAAPLSLVALYPTPGTYSASGCGSFSRYFMPLSLAAMPAMVLSGAMASPRAKFRI